MITFNKISYKNFLSVGNRPVVITLSDSKITVVSGKNGYGKCLRKSTSFFDIESDDETIALLNEIENKKNN